MGSKPPPAPGSPVSTDDLKGAWGGAMGAISGAGDNAIPSNVWSMYSPELMTSTPYGYNPNDTVSAGQFMSNQGRNLYASGDAAWQAGADPQNELYNRTQNQVEQQTRAAQAARGIQTTPYGASVEAGNMSNFNIDWQNQQLQRLLSGLGGQINAYGAGGQQMAAGEQLSQGAPQNMATYASMLQQLGMNTTGPEQWQAGAYSNLFGTGAGAQQGAYQQQLAQWKEKQAQSNAMWGGIGSLVGKVATAPMSGGASLFA